MKALLIDKYGISKESIDYTTYALGDGNQTLLNSCDIHISPGDRWRCWNATLQVDSFTDAADMV